MYGFEQNEPNWAFYGPYVNIGNSDDYLIYSWTLRDEQGVIASGSYNSQTGESTGGTGSSGANFTISRYPVGDLIFTATGSLHTTGTYGPCGESINADADMLSNSFWLTVNPNYTYQFTSKASGLVIQIPGGSTADYTQVTQDTNTSAAQQKWTLSVAGSYKISNTATGVPLYNDTTSQHTSVVQLSGSSTSWRFVSVGDGSYYLTVYLSHGGGPGFGDTSHVMGVVAGSQNPGAGIETAYRAGLSSQQWSVTVIQ